MSKILIIEKDKNFSSNIREILELYGYNIEQCYEPEKIKEQINQFVPELLIISVSIDLDNSGLDLAENLFPDIDLPILFISDKYLQEIYEKGINAFKNSGVINKPFTSKELVNEIKALIKLTLK